MSQLSNVGFLSAWHQYVAERSGEWTNQIFLAVKQADELLVVFYEDLKADLGSALRKLAEFLGVRINDYRLNCTLANSQGFAKRSRKKIRDLRVFYTTEEIDLLNKRISQIRKLFQSHGVSVPDCYILGKKK